MRTNPLVLTGMLVMSLVAPAAAQPQNISGSYDVKFDEVATTCDPVRFAYTRGTVKIASTKTLRVDISTAPAGMIPVMTGGAAKSGKVNAKTPKKSATTIQGLDGKYSVSGRVDDGGVLELVLVAEYLLQDSGKPLCTQSWNLRGIKQAAADKKPSDKKKASTEASTEAVPAMSFQGFDLMPAAILSER